MKSVEEVGLPVDVVGEVVGHDSDQLLTADLSKERLETEISLLTNTLVETERRLRASQEETSVLQTELDRIHNTALWSFRDRMGHLFPWESRRRAVVAWPVRRTLRILRAGTRALHRAEPPPRDPCQQLEYLEYQEWLRLYSPTPFAFERMRTQARSWGYRPGISLLMLAFDYQADWLKEAITSVIAQVYDNWTLSIACKRSSEAEILALMAGFPNGNSINLVVCDDNTGAAKAYNQLLASTDGDFLTFIEPHAILQPHALHSVVRNISGVSSTCDLVYSDEDKILAIGERGDPSFKPGWSPTMLLGWNYIRHLALVRRSLVENLGGFRAELEGAEEYDLFLRVAERARDVQHVSDVLYTSLETSGAKSEEAGIAAVRDALVRRGRVGTVSKGQCEWFETRYELLARPTVEILIPTRDRLELLKRTVESIEAKTTYQNYHITIIDNDSRDPATLEWLASTKHSVLRHPGIFSFSRMMNAGVSSTKGEMLLFLNNDTELITPDWLEAMLEQAQFPEVGGVGCRLLYPDGSVQHEGTALGLGHVAVNIATDWRVVRELSAVTAAAMMMRRDVFMEVRGFDERLPIVYNDVDLCLRIRQAGYKVVYTPFAEFYHYESASRGKAHSGDADAAEFKARWGDENTIPDPYMSPHVVKLSPLHLRLNPYLRAGERAMSERATASV